MFKALLYLLVTTYTVVQSVPINTNINQAQSDQVGRDITADIDATGITGGNDIQTPRLNINGNATTPMLGGGKGPLENYNGDYDKDYEGKPKYNNQVAAILQNDGMTGAEQADEMANDIIENVETDDEDITVETSAFKRTLLNKRGTRRAADIISLSVELNRKNNRTRNDKDKENKKKNGRQRRALKARDSVNLLVRLGEDSKEDDTKPAKDGRKGNDKKERGRRSVNLYRRATNSIRLNVRLDDDDDNDRDDDNDSNDNDRRRMVMERTQTIG